MKKNNIGVDCSGFAFWMLDAYDQERGGDGITNDIPGAKGKYLQARANVRMLTDPDLTVGIDKVSLVRPGDMIRLNAGRHILVVVSLKKNDQGGLEVMEYAHSSAKTRTTGVHMGQVIILKSEAGIEEQKWTEEIADGNNYFLSAYLPGAGDGIKRFKFWS